MTTSRDLAVAVAKLAPAMDAAVEELDELLRAALADGKCSLTPPGDDGLWRGAVEVADEELEHLDLRRPAHRAYVHAAYAAVGADVALDDPTEEPGDLVWTCLRFTVPAADVEAEATSVKRSATPGWRPSRLMEGQPVHHARFGTGRVEYVGRDGGNWRVEVRFPDAGRMTFDDDDPDLMPGCGR